jgi:hypothetical protein
VFSEQIEFIAFGFALPRRHRFHHPRKASILLLLPQRVPPLLLVQAWIIPNQQQQRTDWQRKSLPIFCNTRTTPWIGTHVSIIKPSLISHSHLPLFLNHSNLVSLVNFRGRKCVQKGKVRKQADSLVDWIFHMSLVPCYGPRIILKQRNCDHNEQILC